MKKLLVLLLFLILASPVAATPGLPPPGCNITPAANMQVANITGTSATLSWTPGTGGNYVKLWVSTDPNPTANCNHLVNKTADSQCAVNENGVPDTDQADIPAVPGAYQVNNLQPNTTYYWRLMMWKESGCDYAAPVISFVSGNGGTTASPTPSPSASPAASPNPSTSPSPSPSASPSTNHATLIIRKFKDNDRDGVWDSNEGSTGREWQFQYRISSDPWQDYKTAADTGWGGAVDISLGTKVEVKEIEQNGWTNSTGLTKIMILNEAKTYYFDFGNFSSPQVLGVAAPAVAPQAGSGTNWLPWLTVAGIGIALQILGVIL